MRPSSAKNPHSMSLMQTQQHRSVTARHLDDQMRKTLPPKPPTGKQTTQKSQADRTTVSTSHMGTAEKSKRLLSPDQRQQRHQKRYSLIQSQKEKDLRKQLLKMEEDDAAVRQRIETKLQDRRSKSAKQAADKQAIRDEREKQLQRERQKEIKSQQHQQTLQEQRLIEQREADAQKRHEEAMLKSEKISNALRAKSTSELHRQQEIEARIKAADARQEAIKKLKVYKVQQTSQKMEEQRLIVQDKLREVKNKETMHSLQLERELQQKQARVQDKKQRQDYRNIVSKIIKSEMREMTNKYNLQRAQSCHLQKVEEIERHFERKLNREKPPVNKSDIDAKLLKAKENHQRITQAQQNELLAQQKHQAERQAENLRQLQERKNAEKRESSTNQSQVAKQMELRKQQEIADTQAKLNQKQVLADMRRQELAHQAQQMKAYKTQQAQAKQEQIAVQQSRVAAERQDRLYELQQKLDHKELSCQNMLFQRTTEHENKKFDNAMTLRSKAERRRFQEKEVDRLTRQATQQKLDEMEKRIEAAQQKKQELLEQTKIQKDKNRQMHLENRASQQEFFKTFTDTVAQKLKTERPATAAKPPKRADNTAVVQKQKVIQDQLQAEKRQQLERALAEKAKKAERAQKSRSQHGNSLVNKEYTSTQK